MHYATNRGNKEIPLAILSKILPQSCVTPPYIIQAKGLHMIVLVSLIVLLGGFLVSTIFCIVHPVPTSSFIQLNDFCTCTCSPRSGRNTWLLWRGSDGRSLRSGLCCSARLWNFMKKPEYYWNMLLACTPISNILQLDW